MAKRTPGLEKAVSIIPKAIHELGPKQEREYYQHWVLWHWADIVGETYAHNVKAVAIDKKSLYVSCYDPAWANETRYRMPQIVQQVNNYAGAEMIKDIQFNGSWRWKDYAAKADSGKAVEQAGEKGVPSASNTPNTHNAQEMNWARERAKMPLGKQDLQQAEKLGAKLEDEELALKIRELYRKNRQLEKLREKNGWHPCRSCGSLCPPEEVICHRCVSKKLEDVRARIRAVLRDIPWARCKEVSEYVPECTPKLLNEQRAAMVQMQAAKVSILDHTSMEAKTLVMLYRCLPPEQLTEEAIKRAFYELRFSLYWPPDFKLPKRYEAIPLRHAEKRQYGKKKKTQNE